jgi:hypothetical protein
MSSIENSLFNKAKDLNPNLTETEFNQKREEALARANAGDHVMTDVNGVLMEEPPTGDALREINEDRNSMATGR